MTSLLRTCWQLGSVVAGAVAGSASTVLTSPAKGAATVAARCCPALLPVCLYAIFANLTTEQRSQLATTITAALTAAAARQPTRETPTMRTEGTDHDQH